MRYITDNMLNGLAKDLTGANIPCETAIRAVRGDEDSSEKLPDAKIFRYLLEKKYAISIKKGSESVALISADKDLARYCEEFGLPCVYVQKPGTGEFGKLSRKLIAELGHQ
jgi:hypothetical protein